MNVSAEALLVDNAGFDPMYLLIDEEWRCSYGDWAEICIGLGGEGLWCVRY